MTVTYHTDVAQGSADWFKLRCGLLTASEMKLIITPTLKVANNDKERAHLYALLAQRVAGYAEDTYEGFDMLRGREDEIDARIKYSENYASVEDCGFITNDKWGFTLGYSPDGLVGEGGLIEAKSRKHKFQVETLLDSVPQDTIPDEFMIQVQMGLLVSERDWCDFISFSAGLPMATVCVEPDRRIQDAIVNAATAFEARIAIRMAEFAEVMNSGARLLATERRMEMEITI